MPLVGTYGNTRCVIVAIPEDDVLPYEIRHADKSYRRFRVPAEVINRGTPFGELADSRSYLAQLPDSQRTAKDVLEWGEQHLDELGQDERFALADVRLVEPVEVAALFDFGLTPRHLRTRPRR